MAEEVNLNVVIHGLVFPYQDMKGGKPDGIRALIPNVGAAHAYLAGNWLGEVTLAPGQYELAGVRSGVGTFDENEHSLIKGTLRPGAERESYATIHFPQPDAIRCFRIITLKRKQLNGDSSREVLAASGTPGELKMADVHIFHYQCSRRLMDVRLGNHLWAPDADRSKNFCNLHIFASPQTRPFAIHNLDEFRAGMSLLQNVDLSLENPEPIPPLPRPGEMEALWGGQVLREELEDLPSRNIRLTDMGNLLRDKKDLMNAWSPFEDLGEPGSCKSGGGFCC